VSEAGGPQSRVDLSTCHLQLKLRLHFCQQQRRRRGASGLLAVAVVLASDVETVVLELAGMIAVVVLAVVFVAYVVACVVVASVDDVVAAVVVHVAACDQLVGRCERHQRIEPPHRHLRQPGIGLAPRGHVK
jgi:hypothetical protein